MWVSMAIGMAVRITSRKMSNAADRLRYLRGRPGPMRIAEYNARTW